MDLITFEIIIASTAIIAGFIGALIGLGGGIIITPLLVLAFGIDIKYAMGAALTSVVATSSGAAAAYVRDGISNIKVGTFLSIATTLGAVLGAYLATRANVQALSVLFGVALLIVALLSILKKHKNHIDKPASPLAEKLQLPGTYTEKGKTYYYPVFGVIPGFCVMYVAGILSGLLGIGSGAFKVLGMDQIMKIPFKVTTATSNFMIGVTAAASVGVYLKSGFIDPLLALPVALGVLLGAFIGARLLPYAPVKLLKFIFLIAIVVIGVQMILQGFHAPITVTSTGGSH